MFKNFSYTLKNLILLLLVFVFGLSFLILLHLFFLNLIENLDKKTENLKAKMEIGELIVNDLHKIRSDFYELATSTTNVKGMKLINQRIENKVEEIEDSLNILENGGTLQRTIRLNIVGHNDTKKVIIYKKESNNISLEVIDLSPKIIQFEEMLQTLNELLEKQFTLRRENDFQGFLEQNKTIKRFYKSTPAFFVRVTENANRLLYEGAIELTKLQAEIKKQKKQYIQLELLLILMIILTVLILGLLIAIQINKNSKKLQIQERSTRGILDAQKNIVVVSNGDYMIDANQALIDFFDDYDSFDDFKKEHICICDFFIDIEDDDYVIDKDYEGRMWFEYILDNPNKLHKVAMYKEKELNYFTITATKKILDSKEFIVIVALNNITKEIETQKELKALNDNLENMVNDKTKELKDLNENLELKIKEEVEKNREKDKTLIQQGRFAALGEMIGNIAHQWRQPLSAISSTASAVQVQRELGIATDKDIDESYVSIMKYVQFLNQTIEDFRSFFRKDKEQIKFNIIEVLNNSITITSAVFKDYEIVLTLDIKEEQLISKGFPNELSQVFLNILNNAKDVLKDKKFEKRHVYIKAYSTNQNNVIDIFDSAGGIPAHIKDKVFDPYFTTKHKSQGTGIGLYMSKDIIEKHMNGSLTAMNSDFFIEQYHYFGACFKIELPKL
ncbi:MAG: HAMP domain-containing histidine kinase [Campylobacteraceae bacterium]|nr:HAMP domain-containing histidine kinase [Campylobacteraceae bacterium]